MGCPHAGSDVDTPTGASANPYHLSNMSELEERDLTAFLEGANITIGDAEAFEEKLTTELEHMNAVCSARCSVGLRAIELSCRRTYMPFLRVRRWLML